MTRWVTSGAAELTGRPDGPPLDAPRAIVERIECLGAPLGVDVLELATERARGRGMRRRGRVSCGGGARLVRCADGWVAANLSRPEDVAAIAAWFELDEAPCDPWPTVEREAAPRPVVAVVERGVLLGIAVSALGEHTTPGAPPVAVTRRPGPPPGTGVEPLVVDLSALWAGPLCARLLADAGCRVVQLESVRRPDPMRDADPALFGRLHAGLERLVLDLATRAGRHELQSWIARADVVIEAARPRALDQLGVARAGPAVWVAISGHGRARPERVAFGDDAAVAGGLVGWDGDEPCFAGDAIADPLTGVAAASAALRALRDRAHAPVLVDAAMAGVAGWVAAPGGPWVAA